MSNLSGNYFLVVTSALWQLLALVARDSHGEAAAELTRLLVTESGAEHAIVSRPTGIAPHTRLHETGSRGSRLVVTGARGMFVLEHGHKRSAFAHLSPEQLDRWATLADLVVPSRPRRPPRPSEAEARAEVTAALRKTAGNITHAAALLGLSRLGLKKRMVRLGLRTSS